MAEIESERRLAAHAERGSVDDEVAAPLAIVEGEVGRGSVMVDRGDVMLAAGIELVQ